MISFFVSNCSQAESKKIHSGINFEQKNFEINDRIYRFNLFKLNLNKIELKSIFSTTKAESIESLVTNHQALMGINSNFFDENSKPLGLIINQSEKLNPFKNISWWGVFYLKNNQPHISHSSTFKPDPEISFAIQAGPRLVVDGEIPQLKKNISPKTAICITPEKDVIFVVTQNFIDINQFAQFMKKPRIEGGLNCRNALNLDGGGSTQLFVNQKDFSFLNISGTTPIPVAIGVFAKD